MTSFHTQSICFNHSEVNIAGRDQINDVYASELCNVLGMTKLIDI